MLMMIFGLSSLSLCEIDVPQAEYQRSNQQKTDPGGIERWRRERAALDDAQKNARSLLEQGRSADALALIEPWLRAEDIGLGALQIAVESCIHLKAWEKASSYAATWKAREDEMILGSHGRPSALYLSLSLVMTGNEDQAALVFDRDVWDAKVKRYWRSEESFMSEDGEDLSFDVLLAGCFDSSSNLRLCQVVSTELVKMKRGRNDPLACFYKGRSEVGAGRYAEAIPYLEKSASSEVEPLAKGAERLLKSAKALKGAGEDQLPGQTP